MLISGKGISRAAYCLYFGKNSLGDRGLRQGQRAGTAGGQVADSAELVAQRILEAAQTEPAEQYMNS